MPEGTTPERKWAGKYESPEALEKGFDNLVREVDKIRAEKLAAEAKAIANERLVGEMKGIYEAQREKRDRAPVVRDGEFDESALQAMIDERLAPLAKQVSDMPRALEGALGAILAPVAAQNAAAGEFFASDEVDAKFDQREMASFLRRNARIADTFKKLTTNPETAPDAYEYVYSMWKATVAPKSAVDAGKKRDAGTTPATGGPPAEMGEAESKSLNALAKRARVTRDDRDIVAYMKARLEGTRELGDLKDLAAEKGWRE